MSHIFKKCDNLDKSFYQPVSILVITNRVLEDIIANQLTVYFSDLLCKFLYAFRKGYGCQDVLTRLVEDFRKAMDKGMYVGCVLIDLSKAFDCLPHKLLLAKLRAYGVSMKACSLFRSYLSNRFQRVKIGSARSEWLQTQKGVPQGSVLGPILFNIFINDIFSYLRGPCTLYNYANDNTIGYRGENLQTVLTVLSE